MTNIESSSSYSLAEHIHPLLHDGGIVYFNSQEGTWCPIGRRLGATLLRACGALTDTQLHWAELDQPEPERGVIIEDLQNKGLLIEGPGAPRSWPQVKPIAGIEFNDWGIVPLIHPLPDLRPPETRLERLAEQTLMETLSLLHEHPFPALVEEIKQLRGFNAPTPDIKTAREIAQAVYQVSDWYAGKFACLEQAAATVLVAAKEGWHVELQYGTSVDYIAYHAWPSVQEQPIILPHEASISGRFYPVFKI